MMRKTYPETMLVIALVAENGRQETRLEYYALCWKQYLAHFTLGIAVWQRGHDVMFPEWYPVQGGHTAIANSSNGAVHKNYQQVAELSWILMPIPLYLALIV